MQMAVVDDRNYGQRHCQLAQGGWATYTPLRRNLEGCSLSSFFTAWNIDLVFRDEIPVFLLEYFISLSLLLKTDLNSIDDPLWRLC